MTYIEFKKWLTEMIVAKGGELPDYNDWKEIKQKMDLVNRYDEVTYKLPDMHWAIDKNCGGNSDFSVLWNVDPSSLLFSDPRQLKLELELEKTEFDLDMIEFRKRIDKIFNEKK